jgi:hypothetical protein
VATVGISKTASAAGANAAYRQGLAAAIARVLEAAPAAAATRSHVISKKRKKKHKSKAIKAAAVACSVSRRSTRVSLLR